MDWIPSSLADLQPLDRLRHRLRSSELWFIGLALVIGMAAGLTTFLQSDLADRLQRLLYGIPAGAHLSTLTHVTPLQLLMLPLGGLLLGGFTLLVAARKRRLVDAVEANALHGGRMSLRDSLVVSGQTLLSNGCGASVGLEAAYVQMGSGVASLAGRWARLRRMDQRTLVGAGAGAAIAAAFGAPLTGAFYAFEIVIGAYAPAALAPVAAACLGAVSIGQLLGATAYQIDVTPIARLTGLGYALYVLMALLCAGVGIGVMRLVAVVDRQSARLPLPAWSRPAFGGLLLMPLAAYTPQVLSAGHGALSHDLHVGYAVSLVAILLLAKIAASVVSLSFGYRGGLFFASLFLGSLFGHLFASLLSLAAGAPLIDNGNASLVGMAAMAVAIVGGPLTMSMLVLEVTHDFGLTSAAVAAALVSNTLVRNAFGYSFSTWRLHLRGENIKSPRDIGWAHALTAAQMMRAITHRAPASLDLAEFRQRFPLGSASRVVLLDADDRYAGIVSPVIAHSAPAVGKSGDPVSTLANNRGRFINQDLDILAVMRAFDAAQSDELAVLDEKGHVLGLLTDAYVRKRYAEELENHQKELFGER